MNFFQKLFHKESEQNEEQVTRSEKLTDEKTDISELLFVDNNEPAQIAEERSKENKLKTFLDTNFAAKGYSDGYELQSSEILYIGIKKIKSEFRLIIDQIVAEKNAEIFELKNHIINVESISEKLKKQLENRIQELQGLVIKIEKEKVLSAEDEGIVMVSIHNYHDGFIRGLEMYQQEKIFAKSTGLYN